MLHLRLIFTSHVDIFRKNSFALCFFPHKQSMDFIIGIVPCRMFVNSDVDTFMQSIFPGWPWSLSFLAICIYSDSFHFFPCYFMFTFFSLHKYSIFLYVFCSSKLILKISVLLLVLRKLHFYPLLYSFSSSLSMNTKAFTRCFCIHWL